jgi:2-phosphoglycolate phosphatase
MIEADTIFFDVDGTLVDSTTDIANAVNNALGVLKLPQLSKDRVASYIGTGVKDLFRKSVGAGNEGLIDKGVEIFSEYYAAHSTDKSVLYPHVRETLEHFKEKRKYIVTNRYAKFAEMTLKNLGIRSYFEGIFGGDDEGCLKPSACVLDSVISKFNIDKSRSLIVGDMAIDVETGKNAGIMTCWVTYGLGKAEDVKPLKPDFVIDDMMQLKNIIR